MKEILIKIEVIVSVLLAISILMQSKSGGMGSMGGADDSESEQYSTKRGAEKVIHTATVVLAIIFAGIAAIYPLV